MPKSIKESVDPIAKDTARRARELLSSDPPTANVVLGLGDCELSHGAKVLQKQGGTWISKTTWPYPPQTGRSTQGRPAREVDILGTAESRDLAEQAIGSMEKEAAEGTEAAFREILDALLDAGVPVETLIGEVHAALARSVSRANLRKKNGFNLRKQNGFFAQPQRERGRACLSYLRAAKRARLVLRELRRLERESGGRTRWDPLSPGIGTAGAGGSRRGNVDALVDTSVRNARVEAGGRIRSSGRNFLLVMLPMPYATAYVRWVGPRRTARACREAAIALDVMRS